MAIESAVNHLIVEIQEPYQKNFYNAIRMSNLDPGTSVNPADYATITGKVISVPRVLCNRRDYRGVDVSDIKVGDVALFSYTVVHAFNETQTGESSFTNEFRVGNRYYWRVDAPQVFGYIRDGEVHMLNGYVMISEVVPPHILHLPTIRKREVFASPATVLAIGKNVVGKKEIDVKPDDKIGIDFRKVANYAIGENKFAIVRQKDILYKQ